MTRELAGRIGNTVLVDEVDIDVTGYCQAVPDNGYRDTALPGTPVGNYLQGEGNDMGMFQISTFY